MGELVRLDVSDGVAVVRLDRPPVNAIDLRVGLELQEAIGEAGGRDDVGVIVVWGGPRIFAAGADIKAMAGWGPDEVRASVEALGAACDLLEDLPKISIAAVNGYALGGGCELALGCDFRYAAEDAELGQPEIRLGVIPGAGGTQRLLRLVGPSRARDLVYTGRSVASEEARRIGLVDLVLPPDEVMQVAVAGARDLAAGPRAALGAAKQALRAAETLGREGFARERELFLGLFGTPDQREGMRAFLEKRDPRFGPNRAQE
jgi:enoyl-CoA hydratase/carnithine racemase